MRSTIALRRRPLLLLALLAATLACAATAQDERPVNGVLSTIGEGQDQVQVLITWGTPREMGYAQGKLLREEIVSLYRNAIPRFLLGMGKGADEVDRVWETVEPFVPTEDKEEMEGLVEGVGEGLSLRNVHRLHVLPEIAEWHCSFFAAWGQATRDGHFVQIRALDFATEATIQQHPLITVYCPTGGEPYASVGWAGFTGMVTGTSARGITMSEIGDNWDEATDTYEGIPMVFLMKDVVRNAATLEEAVERVRTAPRTSCYLYCLGDANAGDARALQTSHGQCLVYSPETLPFEVKIPDCVYMSMGCEPDGKWNRNVGKLLEEANGRIDPVFAMEQVMRGLGTGDLHAVCVDATAGTLWVANAEGDIPNVIDGFNRPFVEFDLTAAYAQARALAGR